VDLQRLESGAFIAVKTLRAHDLDLTAELNFFRSLTNSIDYHHIVRFIGAGQESITHHWQLYMEYCEGGTLADYIMEHCRSGDWIPEPILISWGKQLCEGLAVMARKGFVHRDLTPRNILFFDKGMLLVRN
jgi:serine/threonine protein kinase